jgi:CHAP domain
MTDARQNIVAWAKYFAGKVDKFVYSEGNDRMSAIGQFPIKFPIHADCSAFVTLCYWLAGADDPNGQNYDHEGYTGTLLGHGLHINETQIQPGDAVVYGGGEGEHTALIVQVTHGQHGTDILTVSHGGPTGQSPIYCWVNKPVNGPQGEHPVDGRQPQTLLRFVTAQVGTAHPIPVV